jgi:hypothetical protein
MRSIIGEKKIEWELYDLRSRIMKRLSSTSVSRSQISAQRKLTKNGVTNVKMPKPKSPTIFAIETHVVEDDGSLVKYC